MPPVLALAPTLPSVGGPPHPRKFRLLLAKLEHITKQNITQNSTWRTPKPSRWPSWPTVASTRHPPPPEAYTAPAWRASPDLSQLQHAPCGRAVNPPHPPGDPGVSPPARARPDGRHPSSQRRGERARLDPSCSWPTGAWGRVYPCPARTEPRPPPHLIMTNPATHAQRCGARPRWPPPPARAARASKARGKFVNRSQSTLLIKFKTHGARARTRALRLQKMKATAYCPNKLSPRTQRVALQECPGILHTRPPRQQALLPILICDAELCYS